MAYSTFPIPFKKGLFMELAHLQAKEKQRY